MILIGQYDSPFVRRVGVALKLYSLPFRHEPWSVFGDADRLRAQNPLTRVPALVLDDGQTLVDSHLILAWLDGLVEPGKVLWPQNAALRAQAIRVTGLATGMADKAVSLFYEIRLHEQVSAAWKDRCTRQIADTLSVLEADFADHGDGWRFGALSHADVAVATALRFLREVHAERIDLSPFGTLAAHAARMEALPAMQDISQPFIPPT